MDAHAGDCNRRDLLCRLLVAFLTASLHSEQLKYAGFAENLSEHSAAAVDLFAQLDIMNQHLDVLLELVD